MQTMSFETIEQGLEKQEWNTSKQDNVLIQAAIPLLTYVSYMKNFQSSLSIQKILVLLRKKIEIFSETAEERGVRYETVKAAQYCLCTLIDESAARYGWADHEWAAQSLLVSFHNETWGGEHFFELLDKIKKEPTKNIQLIELMYYCLVMGYMGKYQILSNGKVTVENIRKELEKILKANKKEVYLTHLFNQAETKKIIFKEQHRIPLWILSIIGFSLIVLSYTYAQWKLANTEQTLKSRIIALQPAQQKQVEPSRNLYLAPLLKNEIEQKLIQLHESTDKSMITILGDELFTSGSGKIQDRYFPVLARVGQALNHVDGQIEVLGHTDNEPVSGLLYQSNWHLSQARADAVKQILVNYIQDESRVRAEGKGENLPLVTNDSVENRAKNRRVEIIVYLEQGSRTLAMPSQVEITP